MSVDDRGVSIVVLVVGVVGGLFAALFGIWLGSEDAVDAPVVGWPLLIGGSLLFLVCLPALAIRLGISRPPS
jgi:hypothetical protein